MTRSKPRRSSRLYLLFSCRGGSEMNRVRVQFRPLADRPRGQRGLRSASLRIAAIGIAVLSIVQCSDFSIYDLLGGERGGTLEPTATAVNIEVTSTYRAGATGGFEPYSYSVSGNGVPARGSIDPATGVYTAPAVLPDGEIFTHDSIVITDYIGSTVAVTVRSFARLRATPQSATVNANGEIIATISGGVAPYTASVADENGTPDPTSGSVIVAGNSVTFTAPPSPGKSLIVVTDQIDNEVIVTIHVVDPVALQISPSSATLEYGDYVEFAITGESSPFNTSFAPLGYGEIEGADSPTPKYTAPASGPQGVATITVTDSALSTVSATVFVVAGTPDELVIVPSFVEIPRNGSATFSVSGGIAPYEFALQQPNRGTLTVNGATVVYTDAGTPGNPPIRLIVTDQSGQETTATIRRK
ncbi:MAG: hypothetical protein EA382_18175 [Spirochaetaceae bacterium]|nr:MAG: hypothetical protein EA382_18175 [Spirochaetaceae bacterium]